LDRTDRSALPVATARPAKAGALSARAAGPVESAIHGPGEALPDETRAHFESRMGHDFARVRVHRDAAAAKAVGAHAFTVGNDIVFGAGKYQPATPEGRVLLGHELTHVVQQSAAPPGLQRKADTGQTDLGIALLDTPLVDDKSKPPAVKSEVTAEAGFKILKDAFGTLKKDVSQGEVKVLTQAAFQTAYDKVYGASDYSWEKYIKPTFGNIRGFAHEGVNYINKDEPSLDVGTVVHEMLHNNTAGDWLGVVGHQFGEGATEYLTVFAMKKAGEPRASAYEKQLDIVETVVGAGLAEADVQSAYLVSGAQKLVADWFTAAMDSTWTDFRADMDKQDYAKAKLKIKKKSGGAEKK
jgi:hypothetical protein